MKKLLATILAAGMAVSLASCGKEPEKGKEDPSDQPVVTVTETEAARGWEGEYQANDTEEHFRIYDLTDTGFKVEFYHFEEGLLEKFEYDMEFDNDEKTMASEKGSADDNGGWEYRFAFNGDSITVSWQENVQVYMRAS